MSESVQLSKAMSNDRFYKEIDTLVKKHGLNYMDAVLYYCEKNDIEIEAAASMIKSNMRIKSHIQMEGEDINILPKSARLPV